MFLHCAVFEISNALFKVVSHTNSPCSISSRQRPGNEVEFQGPVHVIELDFRTVVCAAH